MAISIYFDTQLMNKSSWNANEIQQIEKWVKEDGFEEKRDEASKLISYMVCSLLDEDCTSDGKVRAKRLGQMFHHFEDIIATTKGGLADKFYRDHLNHMIRVMLLTRAITEKVTAFNLSDKEIKQATLAGLVHDLAYPLSQGYQILSLTISALKKCYTSLTFPEYSPEYDNEKKQKLIELIDPVEDPSFFTPYLEEYNHGLIGAIEFQDYLNPDVLTEYVSLLRAISFHDPSLKIPAELKNSNVLQVLAISDELQDWGRPKGVDKEPAMSEIYDFAIDSNNINGKFIWDLESGISPLRQIYSKIANIKRFNWPSNLNVNLEFQLPRYKGFEIQSFIDVLNELIEYCSDERKDAISDLNNAWKNYPDFYKNYFGDILPQNDNLLKYIKENVAYDQEEKIICFEPTLNEVFSVSKDVKSIIGLRLSIDAGKIKVFLCEDNKQHLGELCNQKDQSAKNCISKLVSMAAIFQGLASRITHEKNGKENSELIVSFPFLSFESLRKVVEILEIDPKVIPVLEDLPLIRSGIVEKGFFTFENC